MSHDESLARTLEARMAERMDGHDAAITSARAAVLNDLKERYIAGDKAVIPLDQRDAARWVGPQLNYFSGQGEMACPVCGAGRLQYWRSGRNGHVHARCSTPGCVAWME